MLYHYTSIQALEGIIREAPSDRGLCFWASRYDCFGDQKEYKLGISVIKKLLPKVERKLQPDRQIANAFVWDDIKVNKMLPLPYVISFTKRFDNDYMWANYADKGRGVVLALEDSENIPIKDMPSLSMRPCLYIGTMSDEDLLREIETEYYNGVWSMLTGPKKDLAFGLLKESPQLFVRFIVMYLLAYVATRIKTDQYDREEEIRAIIPSQRPIPEIITLFNQAKDDINALGIDANAMIQMIENEKLRNRPNGEKVYYKELFLPSRILTKVYIKDPSKYHEVDDILRRNGFHAIDIEILP